MIHLMTLVDPEKYYSLLRPARIGPLQLAIVICMPRREWSFMKEARTDGKSLHLGSHD